MNTALKVFLSMSLSGSLLILALFAAGRLWKDKISRQWQYYIWLVVILRLLLPFGPETSLMGDVYRTIDRAISQDSPQPVWQDVPDISGGTAVPPAVEPDIQADTRTAEPSKAAPSPREAAPPVNFLWMIWLAGALVLLVHKITVYQSFRRYVTAGSSPVSDIGLLDQLSLTAEQMKVKRPVELCVNPLISSPLLIGFFRPCIVLPSLKIPERDFKYIMLHELTHYKRRDIFYKWLVQAAVCLHWFNPLVHLMSREITRMCEFSCDEAVLSKMGSGSAQEYGKTLLDAMEAVGRYKETLGSVTLTENKQLIKERLGAIMKFKTKSTAIRLLTGLLTLCIVSGAAFTGVYPVAAADPESDKSTVSGGTPSPKKSRSTEYYTAQMERYYKAGSVPMFTIAFSYLDEETQKLWLDRTYADQQIAFWGAAVNLLDDDCSLIQHFAEKVYGDGNITFFSVLANHMGEETLEKYLDKSLEDGNWIFQSVLFHTLNLDDAFDEKEEKKEKEWTEARRTEYQAVGITMADEKNYYYQGQLVHVFLDQQANQSFYTLNINPAGTVSVRILRDENNKITGVAYMTDAEVEELFGDMGDDEEEEDTAPKVIPIDLESLTGGTVVWLGEYTLSKGDKIRYDISAETGRGMQVAFARDDQLNTVYYSVRSMRQEGEPLKCAADFTFGIPQSGTYKLFLRATDSDLGNVTGSITLDLASFS